MEENELIKKLSEIKYAPKQEVDERIDLMLKNLEENNNNSVTDSSTQSKNNQSNLFFSLFNMRIKTVALVAIPLIAFGLLIFAVSPMFIPGNLNGKLSEAQKEQIYKNILANNSQVQVKSNAQNFNISEAAGDAQVNAPLDMKLVPVPGGEDNSNKLVTSTFINTPGARSNACKAIYGYNPVSPDKTVSMNFYDNNGNSVSNYVEHYGDIQFISQSSFGNGNSVNIEYKGGKYAVKSIYDYLPQAIDSREMGNDLPEGSEPSVDYKSLEAEPGIEGEGEMDWEAKIKQYFGEDADIIGSETIDGNEYYILQYSYETPCEYSYSILKTNVDYWNGETYEDSIEQTQEDNEKIVIRNYVSAQDYSVYKSDTYLGNTSDNNLIYSSVTQVESKDSTLEAATSKIMFDIDADVKEYRYEDNIVEYDQNKENAKLVDFIINEGYIYADLSNIGFNLISVFPPKYYEQPVQQDQYSQWISSRDFYPEGELGDEIFKMFDNSDITYDVITSLVEYGYSPDTEDNGVIQNLRVYQYENEDDLDIVNSSLYAPVTEKEIEDIEININGEMKAGKLYKYISEYESFAYEEAIDEPASVGEQNIEPSAGTDSKMRIDPGVEGKPVTMTDTGYTIIIQMEGYKLVIRDTVNGSPEYPQSLETVSVGEITVRELTNADKAWILKAMEVEDIMPMPEAVIVE